MGPRFQEGTRNHRHVTKYVSSKDGTSFKETVMGAELC
jgi:hypothetical protein